MFVYGLVIGGVLGYAFRGAIGRELKVIGADVQAELVVLRKQVTELVATLKAKV